MLVVSCVFSSLAAVSTKFLFRFSYRKNVVLVTEKVSMEGSETESVLILLTKTSSRSHCRVVRRSVVEQPTTAQSLILLFSLMPLTFTFLLRGVCNWFKRCRVSLLWKLLLKACRNMFCWISEKIIYTLAKTMFHATGTVAVSVLFPVALVIALPPYG